MRLSVGSDPLVNLGRLALKKSLTFYFPHRSFHLSCSRGQRKPVWASRPNNRTDLGRALRVFFMRYFQVDGKSFIHFSARTCLVIFRKPLWHVEWQTYMSTGSRCRPVGLKRVVRGCQVIFDGWWLTGYLRRTVGW